MSMKHLLAMTALPLALGACASTDGGTGMASTAPSAEAGDMTPTQRGAYVEMAAASDLFEIQSSNLALTRAQSPAIRQFAQMMIDHHTQTTAQLTAAATAAGTPPAPSLMQMQARMLEQLQAASGAEFDRLYVSQQVQAHQMALALHGNYARRGDTPALRSVAATATPIVQRHLDRARQLG